MAQAGATSKHRPTLGEGADAAGPSAWWDEAAGGGWPQWAWSGAQRPRPTSSPLLELQWGMVGALVVLVRTATEPVVDLAVVLAAMEVADFRVYPGGGGFRVVIFVEWIRVFREFISCRCEGSWSRGAACQYPRPRREVQTKRWRRRRRRDRVFAKKSPGPSGLSGSGLQEEREEEERVTCLQEQQERDLRVREEEEVTYERRSPSTATESASGLRRRGEHPLQRELRQL